MNGPKISKLTFAAIFITREREEGKARFFFYLKIMKKICFEPRSTLFQEISGRNGISRVIERE